MTSDEYVMWFIAMAVLTLVVLGIGTLMMAGVVRRPHRAHASEPEQLAAQDEPAPVEGERHHWYDRFLHAA